MDPESQYHAHDKERIIVLYKNALREQTDTLEREI